MPTLYTKTSFYLRLPLLTCLLLVGHLATANRANTRVTRILAFAEATGDIDTSVKLATFYSKLMSDDAMTFAALERVLQSDEWREISSTAAGRVAEFGVAYYYSAPDEALPGLITDCANGLNQRTAEGRIKRCRAASKVFPDEEIFDTIVTKIKKALKDERIRTNLFSQSKRTMAEAKAAMDKWEAKTKVNNFADRRRDLAMNSYEKQVIANERKAILKENAIGVADKEKANAITPAKQQFIDLVKNIEMRITHGEFAAAENAQENDAPLDNDLVDDL
jgi:hypothetical protein